MTDRVLLITYYQSYYILPELLHITRAITYDQSYYIWSELLILIPDLVSQLCCKSTKYDEDNYTFVWGDHW